MTPLDKAIAVVGGQKNLANLLRCSSMTITHWKSRGIPAERVVDIEEACGGEVTRQELRPDLYEGMLHPAA